MNIKIQNLGDIAEVRSGFPLRSSAQKAPPGEVPLVQLRDVDPFYGVNWDQTIKISTDGRRSPDWLKENDILFAGRGHRIFAALVEYVEIRSVASPHFYVLSSKDNTIILPSFLAWYLNSPAAKKYYAANQEGSAMPYISRNTLNNMPIKLPDIAIQEQISATHKCWIRQRQLLKELTETKDNYINTILGNSLSGEPS